MFRSRISQIENGKGLCDRAGRVSGRQCRTSLRHGGLKISRIAAGVVRRRHPSAQVSDSSSDSNGDHLQPALVAEGHRPPARTASPRRGAERTGRSHPHIANGDDPRRAHPAHRQRDPPPARRPEFRGRPRSSTACTAFSVRSRSAPSPPSSAPPNCARRSSRQSSPACAETPS
jgi:hypothetical protein